MQKGKEGTGRIVMWMMGITNSYTLEASFAGSTLGSRSSSHFSAQDYEQMGKSFCQTLLDFYDEEPRKVRFKRALKALNLGSRSKARLSASRLLKGTLQSAVAFTREHKEVQCIPISASEWTASSKIHVVLTILNVVLFLATVYLVQYQ